MSDEDLQRVVWTITLGDHIHTAARSRTDMRLMELIRDRMWDEPYRLLGLNDHGPFSTNHGVRISYQVKSPSIPLKGRGQWRRASHRSHNFISFRSRKPEEGRNVLEDWTHAVHPEASRLVTREQPSRASRSWYGTSEPRGQ